MPFRTTNTVPKVNAKVTVRFAGLMMLKAGPNNTCEVGVHRVSPIHTFQAMLVVDKPELPLTFIRLTRGPLSAPLSIRLRPDPENGFQVFEGRNFSRDSARSHPFDSRWALNPRDWHPTADYNEDAGPGVTLNCGTLYSANLTRDDLNPELIPADQKSNLRTEPLHKFAADLAVAIEIPNDSVLVVRWEDAGIANVLSLPRETDPRGTTYTISLMNDPDVFTLAPEDDHDELELYYQVLRDRGAEIPPGQQYRINVPDPGRSDEIPCMSVLLNP